MLPIFKGVESPHKNTLVGSEEADKGGAAAKWNEMIWISSIEVIKPIYNNTNQDCA